MIDISEQLQQQLSQQLNMPVSVDHHACCGSTNRECMALYQADRDMVQVVIASQQTEGRGRRGRRWVSPSGQNIYCSVGLIKQLPAELLGLVSLQAGISIVHQLQHLGFNSVHLKWPNDIKVGEQKLGGILTETRVLAADRFYLVIGFGLNVNQQWGQIDSADREALTQPVTSLFELAGQEQSIQQLLGLILPDLIHGIQQLSARSASVVVEEFTRLDPLINQQVQVDTSLQSMTGQYLGIDSQGRILVDINGVTETFSAADISLRGS